MTGIRYQLLKNSQFCSYKIFRRQNLSVNIITSLQLAISNHYSNNNLFCLVELLITLSSNRMTYILNVRILRGI